MGLSRPGPPRSYVDSRATACEAELGDLTCCTGSAPGGITDLDEIHEVA